MKFVALALASALIFSTQVASASEFFSIMEKIYKNYELCDSFDSNQVKSAAKFKTMYNVLKLSDSKGRRSSVTVQDLTTGSITLSDKSKKSECTMHVDGYDGRCFYVLCD